MSIFGGSGGYESRTALKMYYDGHGNPLRLLWVVHVHSIPELHVHIFNTCTWKVYVHKALNTCTCNTRSTCTHNTGISTITRSIYMYMYIQCIVLNTVHSITCTLSTWSAFIIIDKAAEEIWYSIQFRGEWCNYRLFYTDIRTRWNIGFWFHKC